VLDLFKHTFRDFSPRWMSRYASAFFVNQVGYCNREPCSCAHCRSFTESHENVINLVWWSFAILSLGSPASLVLLTPACCFLFRDKWLLNLTSFRPSALTELLTGNRTGCCQASAPHFWRMAPEMGQRPKWDSVSRIGLLFDWVLSTGTL